MRPSFHLFRTIALVLACPAVVLAQSSAGGSFTGAAGSAERVVPAAAAVPTVTPPTIDGRLDDAAWADAPVVDIFTQRDPEEGAPGSERTEVRFAYDDEAIYIGAWLHDRGAVTTRLGRRDMDTSSSDWLTVSFDSFYDRRTAFRFEVNPSGVRRDSSVAGGGNDSGDSAWDAVWDAATSVGDDGWMAEMRIPFSQMGFAPAEEQTWGLQIERRIDRRQELAMFAFTPKSEQGGVPTYGDLTGLRSLRQGRRLELLPYVVSNGLFAGGASNDLAGENELKMNAGLDARYRVTPNLTLAATANPDFGQVEVDPAVINLTAFETRYQERRPFFVEGSGSFNFGSGVGGPSAAASSVLYSRRFGRSPQLRISGNDVELPDTATILGAAKLTGKTASGWNVGVLNAVTDAEHGRYTDEVGRRQRTLVEPRTNYFVGRISRDLRRGQSSIGGIFTSANRDLAGDRLAVDSLRSSAYTGGLDFIHQWANFGWRLAGFLVGSHVAGSAAAIEDTQRFSSRYFQRPDAAHLTLDPTATSMNGAAASLNLRKAAGLHWTTDSWVQMVSPGFEINDVGFLSRTDRRAFGQGVTYREQTPGDVFRQWSLTTYVNRAWNYDGDVIDYFYWSRLSLTHLSYWQVSAQGWYEPTRTDDRLTRGGPIAMIPASWRYNASVSSDPRKAITGSASFAVVANRAGSHNRTIGTSIDFRTSPRWNLSIGPEYQRVKRDAQYVAAIRDAAMTSTFGTRYIFAPLDQTEMSIVTRLNYTFTPDLTLEVYIQPLVSHGDYGTPKEFQRPRAYEFLEYGRELGTIERDGSNYIVDPDGVGPVESFSVRDRSFTTRSLRGNAVLRWEYRPGSLLYLVWQQNRFNPDPLDDDFSVRGAFGRLFEGHADNVFVVKWSYWLNP